MAHILAMDLGLKRIGVALCRDEQVVTPLTAVLRKNRNQAASEIKALLKEWEIDIFVVGVPIGGEHEAEMKRRIEHFVSLVDFKAKVVFQDEAFSSFEAESHFKGQMKQKRDGRIDSMAAKIIFERYLEDNYK